MTALEHFRRRGRVIASFLMPLVAVVSINASSACVGVPAACAATGFAKAHDGDFSHGHEDSQGTGHSHGHDDSTRPADSHEPDCRT